MKLNTLLPKNETEDLLLSITKKCETLIKQTHIKPQERLEFEIVKSKEIFSFKSSNILGFDSNSMLGLVFSEVYNSVFSITHEINKFELYTDTFDEFSFKELKDENEEIVNFSNISHEHLPDEMIGPRTIPAFKKLETEKRQTYGYYMILMGFASSPFRDFESYLRIAVGLDEDDIWFI